MDEQEAEIGCYKYCWDRIHNYEYDLVWSCLAVETLQWVHMMNTTVILCDNQRWDSIIEESRIRWLLQQIDIRYCLILDMVSRWARRLHRIETNVQVVDILTKPRGKIKFVIFPNDLESSRDLCKRVLHVAYIELWELWGLGVLTGATYDHRVTHPLLVVRIETRWFALLWNRMIRSPV